MLRYHFGRRRGKEGLEGSEIRMFGLFSVLDMYSILFMLRGRPSTSRGSSIWQTYLAVIMLQPNLPIILLIVS